MNLDNWGNFSGFLFQATRVPGRDGRGRARTRKAAIRLVRPAHVFLLAVLRGRLRENPIRLVFNGVAVASPLPPPPRCLRRKWSQAGGWGALLCRAAGALRIFVFILVAWVATVGARPRRPGSNPSCFSGTVSRQSGRGGAEADVYRYTMQVLAALRPRWPLPGHAGIHQDVLFSSVTLSLVGQAARWRWSRGLRGPTARRRSRGLIRDSVVVVVSSPAQWLNGLVLNRPLYG